MKQIKQKVRDKMNLYTEDANEDDEDKEEQDEPK